ncbi:MAG: peptidylprolyl isomerase [Spirochaetaceae bacterium]|jgi:hypothetical protein|nr:peptidylprolyl isomerase [Spirochaetaceae bacterium]
MSQNKNNKQLNTMSSDGSHGGGELSELARKFKQQPLIFTGTILVLVLVIVAFVLLPMDAAPWSSGGLSSDLLTFGSYDGIPVELTPDSYFAKMRQSYIEYYANSYGWRGEGAETQATRQAFQSALVRTAIFESAKKAHYAPPKALVDKKVAALPKYQENGVFSVLRYRQESAARHLETIQELRDDMIIQRYQHDMAGFFADAEDANPDVSSEGKFIPAIKIASKEVDFIASMAKDARRFSLIAFPYADYPDAELIAYIEKNPDFFKTTHLSQITLTSSEADAGTVLASISSGATNFEEAAKAQSKDSFADSGGDAGERMAYQLDSLIPSEEDRRAVVNLTAGSVSAVIKTSSGWTIFRAESAAKPADTADSAVLTNVRTHLGEAERGVIEDWLIAKAQSFAADADATGLDAALSKHSVSASDFGPVPINYGDNPLFETLAKSNSGSSPELRAGVQNENFWRTAFSLAAGKISAPFVIDASLNSVVVLASRKAAAEDSTANEAGEAEEAEEKTRAYFLDTFMDKSLQDNLSTAILKSGKSIDNFTARYAALFQRPDSQQNGN